MWYFFIDRFRALALITVVMLGWGISSWYDIPRENSPDIDIPLGIVSTAWPGASAQDVEARITNEIEQEIKTLDNLQNYSSVSSEGISTIIVEFVAGTNKEKNFRELRQAIDDVVSSLPDTIFDDPEIVQISTSQTPIMSVSLWGDVSTSELNRAATTLQKALEGIVGVQRVQINGQQDERIHIVLDPLRLQAHHLSVELVMTHIQQASRDIPLGQLVIDNQDISIRAMGELQTITDFAQLPIRNQQGGIVDLGDLGTIKREFAKAEGETFFIKGKDMASTVVLDIIKGAQKINIFAIIEQAQQIISKNQNNGELPAVLKVDLVFDGAKEIRHSLNNLLTTGWQTLALIVAVILLALGRKEAILIVFAIPLCVLIAIAILNLLGETFNFLSLFALILALGLLVDNAIIIVEGISDRMCDFPDDPFRAAKKAIDDLRWPIIAGTLTTIFAFLPMLFAVSGISGEFIAIIPITIAVVLTVSLAVSLVIVPSWGAQLFLRQSNIKNFMTPSWLSSAQNWYRQKMQSILAKLSRQWAVLSIAIVLLVGSISLFALGWIKIEIFASADQDYFTFTVELPVGSASEQTREMADRLHQVLQPYFSIDKFGEDVLANIILNIGKTSSFDPSAQRTGRASSGDEILGVTVNLVNTNNRQTTSMQVINDMRKTLAKEMPDYVDITLHEVEAGPPSGTYPIELRLSGSDQAHLQAMVDQLKLAMQKIDISNSSLTDIHDDRARSVPQVSWIFDRDKLQQYGLNVSGIRQTLRSAVEGVKVMHVTEGTDEIEVWLRLDFTETGQWKDPDSLAALSQVSLLTPTGEAVSLPEVAKANFSMESEMIQHYDGQPTIKVFANISGQATANEFTLALETALRELPLLAGENYVVGGENEEVNKLAGEMVWAMIIAVCLIGMILVLQFDSFFQMLVMLLLLPFSLVGVFVGFWLFAIPVSFPAMIGIVALAGIIINDTIVLMAVFNQRHRENKSIIESFILAGQQRLRPIILTSVTTIVGLLPLTFADPAWQGLGLAVIFGMTFSTVLTLLLVPCVFCALSGLAGKKLN